jgi:hypothetical protein
MQEEYFMNELTDGTTVNVYQDMVNMFYNSVYQTDQNNWLGTFSNFIEFYEENDDVFSPGIDHNLLAQSLQETLSFLTWDYSKEFVPFTITELLQNDGDLTVTRSAKEKGEGSK